jgi:choline kinase
MTIKNCIHKINKNNAKTVVLLSAGQNKCSGAKVPKCLISYNNKCLIDLQIEIITKKHPKSEIIIVIGFESKKAIDYIQYKYPFVRIIENTNFKTTTSLESLRLAINCAISSDVYIIHGDRAFNSTCIDIKEESDPHVVIIPDSINQNNVGIIHQNNKLTNMSYGLKTEWGQMLYIPKSLFDDFRKEINACKSYLNIFELVNQINNCFAFKIHGNRKIFIEEV